MNFIYKNLLIICLLALPLLGKSQFVYVGAGVGLRTTTFHKPQLFSDEKTKSRSTTFEINGMFRPLRNFAIGATISFPISQSSSFSFSEAETGSGNKFNGFGASGYGDNEHSEFIPEIFEYTFEQSASFTIKGRLYAFLNSGLYFDFRVSIMTLRESFIIERDSQGNVPAIDIYHTEDIGLFIPGFGIGLHDHISKQVYIDLSANLDFMNIQNKGFSEEVVYTGSDGDLSHVTFEDQLGGKHKSIVLQVSLGYLF